MKADQQMRMGLETAFIDSNIKSNLAYKPQFISNNHREGRKVLSSIEDELLRCEEFSISVAFITMSGLTPLLQTLKTLEQRGIKGRILTTNYLNFTEPNALKKLAELENIELKMFTAKEEGFHTKGYIFKDDEIFRIIIGSSNMTMSALTKNKEWNTKIISTEQGEYAQMVLEEFESLWNLENSLEYYAFIEEYKESYEKARKERELVKRQKEIATEGPVVNLDKYRLKPNKMQMAFVTNLELLQEEGKDKALLISATGTGKTYAAAFALREMNPKKALFVVHREQIAKQAIKSFKNVFGSDVTFGLLSGTSKDIQADYLFSTMQMMAKSDIREQFNRDEFDVIIVDEVHRAGANSYQNIMEYFKPKFYLGMTASPDRTDGFDVYNLFDHNIAYEIRLQQAMEEDLLCPFHYFGIADLEIDDLLSDERVDLVLEKAEYYGHSGERVKGLVFCSRKIEGQELSRKFNERGYRTVFLSGGDSQEIREETITRLTEDEYGERTLDYIFTVDIFNEGVDIPEVNQVIMLRETESPIVFIQQLGRGLRKNNEKEYVVILDFVGNYTNNFMIPIALSGDRTYNKDNIRRYVMEGERVIPGSSTIHFDEISKKRIFRSIDKMNTGIRLLREKYVELKLKLGKIPTMVEFYQYGEVDPMLFIKQCKSYHTFLTKVEKEYKVVFDEEEIKILEYVSSYVIDGKRVHELIILKELLENPICNKNNLVSKYDVLIDYIREEDYQSAVNILDKSFINSPVDKKKFETVELLNKEYLEKGLVSRASLFESKLKKCEFYRELINSIDYGVMKYKTSYRKHDEDNLVLYQKYSRKDVCRILNWKSDESSTMYGYRIKHNTCPIFVTYHKKEDISSSTKYEDTFINHGLFSWMTRPNVKITSKETEQIINYETNDLQLYLFIKHSDGEGSDFYYMGKVRPIKWRETVTLNDNNKELSIVNFIMEMQNPARADLYEYFTNGSN